MGKYEYMLHTWGGFYNPEYNHGMEAGTFWFDSAEERQAYLDRLRVLEAEYNAKHLVYTMKEGTETRLRTVAKMVFEYGGRSFDFQLDFGYAYPVHSAFYMFEEGNYSCDCNRSSFLRRDGHDVPELGCGDTIKMRDFCVARMA